MSSETTPAMRIYDQFSGNIIAFKGNPAERVRGAELQEYIDALQSRLADAERERDEAQFHLANAKAKFEERLRRVEEFAALAHEMRTETPGHTAYWHMDFLEHWYGRYDALALQPEGNLGR